MAPKKKRRTSRPKRRAAAAKGRSRGTKRAGKKQARRRTAKRRVSSPRRKAKARAARPEPRSPIAPALVPIPGMMPRSEQMEEEFDKILRGEGDDDEDYFDE